MNFRQVHLDFHTSGAISGIGSKFSKEQFQEALKRGHVNSITLFSKCHHGYSYHPTEVNEIHPGLDFDLLGAQLEACRELGVNAPVYISAGLDEKEAVRHPEWLFRFADETLMGGYPNFMGAGYHLLCYNTGYLDLLLKQIEEVMIKYNPSGIFLDISSVRMCYCSSCRRKMQELGLDISNPDDVMKMGEINYANYCNKTREIVKKYNPDATIFHNGGHLIRGRRDFAGYNTHLELESLPTGGWGYDHFPMSAAYTRTLNYDFLGMTGKFHKSWGEFGGYKHPNALRYETALSIACGAKCSIGDQAHPTVEMNLATYDLIGAAYAEVEEKEAWCDNVTAIADIAILSNEAFSPGLSEARYNAPDTGAARMLLEGKYLFNIIDFESDFSQYRLLILPEGIRPDADLADRLNKYIAAGGKILATGTSGLWADKDEFCIDFGADFVGKSAYKPNYFIPTDNVPACPYTQYVMYENGYAVNIKSGKCFALAQDSYFNRTREHFCSHCHTPNNPCDEATYEAAVVTENTAYIGWDIFTDYSKMGSLHLKRLVLAAIEALIGKDKTLSTNLVDRGVVTLMKQEKENRLVNHLLFAHTTIRGENTEIIEDIVPLYNVNVSLRVAEPKRVYLAPQNVDLAYTYENGVLSYTLEKLELHQMIVIDFN